VFDIKLLKKIRACTLWRFLVCIARNTLLGDHTKGGEIAGDAARMGGMRSVYISGGKSERKQL
jgi:hypothetical protein